MKKTGNISIYKLIAFTFLIGVALSYSLAQGEEGARSANTEFILKSIISPNQAINTLYSH